jgi:hypothetical protein
VFSWLWRLLFPPLQLPRHLGSAATVQDEFFRGYFDRAGEDLRLLQLAEPVYWNVHCESRWNVNPGGYYLGLNQFDRATWLANARPGADPFDPYEQGWATAQLMSHTDPGSTAAWARCWPG